MVGYTKGEPGLQRLAIESGAPVIPVAIVQYRQDPADWESNPEAAPSSNGLW